MSVTGGKWTFSHLNDNGDYDDLFSISFNSTTTSSIITATVGDSTPTGLAVQVLNYTTFEFQNGSTSYLGAGALPTTQGGTNLLGSVVFSDLSASPATVTNYTGLKITCNTAPSS